MQRGLDILRGAVHHISLFLEILHVFPSYQKLKKVVNWFFSLHFEQTTKINDFTVK